MLVLSDGIMRDEIGLPLENRYVNVSCIKLGRLCI